MLTKVIPEEKVIATYKAIQRARRIVIVAHKRPDGDAIGSCLGLYHFLYSFERETFVILPDAIPANMSILPSSSEIRMRMIMPHLRSPGTPSVCS